MKTCCPECGFDIPHDEDGCCATCGRDSTGPGADRAVRASNQVKELRAQLRKLKAENAEIPKLRKALKGLVGLVEIVDAFPAMVAGGEGLDAHGQRLLNRARNLLKRKTP